MPLSRKLILLLTLWAYAVQALAGVAVAGCGHEGEAVAAVATVPAAPADMSHGQMDHAQTGQAQTQMSHEQMHHLQHGSTADQPPGQAAAGSPDCCNHCTDGNCSCGSHGCASAQSGVLPAAAPVTATDAAAVPSTRPLDSRLRQAHSLGLIRPPAVS